MSREFKIVAASMSEAFSRIKRDFGSDVLITHQAEQDGRVEISITLPDVSVNDRSSQRERVNGGIGLTNIKPFYPERRIQRNTDFDDSLMIDRDRNKSSFENQDLLSAKNQAVSIPFLKQDADQLIAQTQLKFGSYEDNSRDIFEVNIQTISQVSQYHFLDMHFSKKWIDNLKRMNQRDENILNQALLKSLSFETDIFAYFLKNQVSKKFLFIGPSGSGKTVAIAKLAVMLSLQGHKFSVVSLDSIKSTGIDQLKNYIQPLGVELKIGHSVLKENDQNEIMLIDTPGMNMFNSEDFSYVQTLLSTFNLIPICVLSAEANPLSLDSLFQIWSKLKIEHIMITKIDTIKRYGTVLKAGCHGFTLLGISDAPRIASALKTFDADTIVSMMIQSMKEKI